MSLNINQFQNIQQEQSQEVESVSIFRFSHSLGRGIKQKLRSLGCHWNGLHHGWLSLTAKQKNIEEIILKAKLKYDIQILSLPKNLIPTDPKIAGKQSYLEMLEEQLHRDDAQLLQDIYIYDTSLRPNDFTNPPSEEHKTPEQVLIEKDFYGRVLSLQNTKKRIDQIREELSHLQNDQNEKVLDSDAPLLIAEALIQEHFTTGKHRTLHYCSNMFFEWDQKKYVELKEGRMRQIIYDFLRDAKKTNKSGHLESFNPTKFRVDQIMDAMQAICHQNYTPISGAIWLDGRQEPDPKYLISFKNGLLDIEKWLEDQTTQLIPHSPLLLQVNSLNFDFNPNAPDPAEWLNFLNVTWHGDLESQEALQEWTGYSLTQDTRFHKILLMIGPIRSGKGTIGRISRELLGPFNVVGPTFSSLGKNFGLEPLLNKMLAIISDVRLSKNGGNNITIERLLSISGEDPLTIDRKFLPSVTSQLPTRIMIMSNEIPNLQDTSGALGKRFIILTMNESWLGKEDPNLFSRLCRELPGILIWALKGLARLKKRGKFIQPSSSEEIIETLEELMSPIKVFIDETCEIKPQGRVLTSSLFEAWRNWCSVAGYTSSGSIQSFGRDLKAAFPRIRITRPGKDGERERYYRGLSLRCHHSPSADVRGQKSKESG